MAGQLQQAVMEQTLFHVAKQLENQLDQELHKLDNMQGDDIEQLRQRRIFEMKKQQERTQEWLEKGHGEYRELGDEKEFFKEMKGEERMVCHFYRNNWPCKVMDKHLAILTGQHLETKFVKIDAEKSPYLTEKLKIWMLPTLALIRNEKVIDYVVGFDDFGGTDDFETGALAERLEAAEVIRSTEGARYKAAQAAKAAADAKTIRSSIYQHTGSDEDSDFE